MSDAQGSVTAFERVRRETRQLVDAFLAAWLGARVEDAKRIGPDLEATVDAVRSLTVRGGKRVRAALLAASYEACGGKGGVAEVAMAGVAIELLQTYLLIHDDWMDEDETRRGGPSVHAMLRDRFGDRRAGDAAAILAGDYACGLAQEALFEVKATPERLLGAAKELARVQTEVSAGQLLDVRGWAKDSRGVELVHAMKTASYTAVAPVLMGAHLAGASARQLDALARFAKPLGVAFQLKDDLLGVFGDPAKTGKPSGGDLRRGKRTALVARLELDPEARRLLPRVLGVDDASIDEVNALIHRMTRSGARAHVEERLGDLVKDAREALAGASFTASGKEALDGALVAMTERES